MIIFRGENATRYVAAIQLQVQLQKTAETIH